MTANQNGTFVDLSEDIVHLIWEHLGTGRYRYIAGAHSTFRSSYRQFCKTQSRMLARTDPSCIVENEQYARLYIEDQQERLPSSYKRKQLMPRRSLGGNAAWMVRKGDHEWDDVAHLAAAFGKVDILNLALSQIPAKDLQQGRPRIDICRLVGIGGDLPTLQCALKQYSLPVDTFLCLRAVRGGHLPMLKWAYQNGCPLDNRAVIAAAGHGHLGVLQWLSSNTSVGALWDYRVCAAAAANGQLVLLQWARDHGYPWDESKCSSAAKGGHLPILKWARANQCPWDKNTCLEAARFGHLDVLTWALENGCSWDHSRICFVAGLYGQLHILEWARANTNELM